MNPRKILNKMFALSLLLYMICHNELMAKSALFDHTAIIYKGDVNLNDAGKIVKTAFIEIAYHVGVEEKALAVLTPREPDQKNLNEIREVYFKKTIECEIVFSKKDYPAPQSDFLNFIKSKLRDSILMLHNFKISTVDFPSKKAEPVVKERIEIEFGNSPRGVRLFYVFQHYNSVKISIYKSTEKKIKLAEYIIPKLYRDPSQGYTVESIEVKEVNNKYLKMSRSQLLKIKKNRAKKK